jgi:hypothetical protein
MAAVSENTAAEDLAKMAALAGLDATVLAALRAQGFTSADKVNIICDGSFIKEDASLDALMDGESLYESSRVSSVFKNLTRVH